MGDTPAAAVGDLLGSLQRALSCVSARVLVATARRPGAGPENVLPAGVEPVALAAPGPLALRLGLRYELRPPEAGELRWRAPVVSYFFVLEDEGARELFAFHWHPVGQSAVSWPHVHVGPATGARPPHTAAHVPTGGPLTLAEVLRFCVLDLGVRARRADWRKLLAAPEPAGDSA